MKLTLPSELQHKFKSDEDWKNTYNPTIGANFKRTLPDEVYEKLLQYFEDNHGDRTIVELNKLGFKVVREKLLVTSKNDRSGGEETEWVEHPFICLAKTQGQQRGGFEVAIAVECDGEYHQCLAYINPMGEVDTSWKNGLKIK